ncbi:MAG TPA: hypothetical protein VII56_10050 [Rhizomicrobium sp.]
MSILRRMIGKESSMPTLAELLAEGYEIKTAVRSEDVYDDDKLGGGAATKHHYLFLQKGNCAYVCKSPGINYDSKNRAFYQTFSVVQLHE